MESQICIFIRSRLVMPSFKRLFLPLAVT